MASKLSLLGVGSKVGTVSGWWNLSGTLSGCIAAYQPKGAASYAASKVNLANPGTYDAVEGSAPDWATETGWDFLLTITARRLWTGITPENDQTWSMIVRFDDSTENSGQQIAGCWNTDSETARFELVPRRSVADDMIWRNGGAIATGSRVSSGVMAIAGVNGFHNKTDYGDCGSGVGAMREIMIGGLNYGSGAGRSPYTVYFDGRIQAMAIYDVDISAYISDLTDAMNAL